VDHCRLVGASAGSSLRSRNRVDDLIADAGLRADAACAFQMLLTIERARRDQHGELWTLSATKTPRGGTVQATRHRCAFGTWIITEPGLSGTDQAPARFHRSATGPSGTLSLVAIGIVPQRVASLPAACRSGGSFRSRLAYRCATLFLGVTEEPHTSSFCARRLEGVEQRRPASAEVPEVAGHGDRPGEEIRKRPSPDVPTDGVLRRLRRCSPARDRRPRNTCVLHIITGHQLNASALVLHRRAYCYARDGWRKRGSFCTPGLFRAVTHPRPVIADHPQQVNTQPSLHGYMPLGAESDTPRRGSSGPWYAVIGILVSCSRSRKQTSMLCPSPEMLRS